MSIVKSCLRIILFPWFLWWLAGGIPRWLKKKYHWNGLKGRLSLGVLHFSLFLLVGLPIFLYLTIEIFIFTNSLLVEESPEVRFRIGKAIPPKTFDWDLPGPQPPVLTPVSKENKEAYYEYLLGLFSPVIIQQVSYKPSWDIPLFIDFDGNLDPRDNIDHDRRFRPHHAGVYGEVTAETTDSYYLTYSLYHLRDYDHPAREILIPMTAHDNDNEGLKIRVDKKTMLPKEAEGWFHNRFFTCNQTGESNGTEPIQGYASYENKTHLVVWSQTFGHGVRCAQELDLYQIHKAVKIIRYRGDREEVPIQANKKPQYDATYDIRNFDQWYKYALGPLGHQGQGEHLFEEPLVLGHYPDGKEIVIGRYIGSRHFEVGYWARPKPPWSWDDAWDDLPVAYWHFLPSYAFDTHMGLNVSHRYISNRPLEKIFNMSADEFHELIDKKTIFRSNGEWNGPILEPITSPPKESQRRAFKILLKKYVNYVFNALG